MSKQIWKPGNMLYPVPAVLVSVADSEGKDNLITIAWTGTVCSDPAMTYISVRKERYSKGKQGICNKSRVKGNLQGSRFLRCALWP